MLKRSLASCSQWGHKESDMTEKPKCTHTHTNIHTGPQEGVLGKGMNGIHEI